MVRKSQLGDEDGSRQTSKGEPHTDGESTDVKHCHVLGSRLEDDTDEHHCISNDESTTTGQIDPKEKVRAEVQRYRRSTEWR